MATGAVRAEHGDVHVAVRVARLPETTDRNPYQRLLYDHLAPLGVTLVGTGTLDPRWLRDHRSSVDVLHVHWRLDRLVWDQPLLDDEPAFETAVVDELVDRLDRRLADATALGYRVAWTVHEVGRLEADGGRFDSLAAEVLARHASVLFVHDAATAELVRRRLAPAGDVVVAPVGAYQVAGASGDGARGRASLGVERSDRVLLSFGHQRHDKRLDLLLSAFGRVASAEARLAIVGGFPDPALASAVSRAAHRDRRVLLFPTSVSAPDMADLIAAADACVLARSLDWTPSSLVGALAAGTPVVAADLPSSRDLLGDGAFWFTPDDPQSLAATIQEVASADRVELRARGARGRRHVERRTWAATAQITARALRSVSADDVATPAP